MTDIWQDFATLEREFDVLRTDYLAVCRERDALEGKVSDLEFKVDQQDMELMRATDAHTLLSDQYNVAEGERDHARARYAELAATVRLMVRIIDNAVTGQILPSAGWDALTRIVVELEDL